MAQTIELALRVCHIFTDLVKPEKRNVISADIPDAYLVVFGFLHEPIIIHDPELGDAAKASSRRP